MLGNDAIIQMVGHEAFARGMVYARAKAQEAGYGLETELAEPDGNLVTAAASAMEALEADGVMLINRIKPHTDFESTVIQSGLLKMCAIGFGKFHLVDLTDRVFSNR